MYTSLCRENISGLITRPSFPGRFRFTSSIAALQEESIISQLGFLLSEQMGHGAHTNPMEVVHTVIEVAELARYAVEHRPGRHKTSADDQDKADVGEKEGNEKGEEIERIRLENLKLRRQLARNFVLIQELCKSPDFSNECPPDVSEINQFDSF